MFKIKMADFIIGIDNKYEFVKNQCKRYEAFEEDFDFLVSCTEEEIAAEQETDTNNKFSSGYLESVCIYRRICLNILQYDSLVFHAAVIKVNGDAYAFAARSGTGKSTHISLWKQYLGNRVDIINGDKPILRFKNDELIAYGTPWCGKEGWEDNISAPLKAICFIERAEDNVIQKLDKSDAASYIIRQLLIPEDASKAIKTLELADRILNRVDTWLLGCNISVEAAKVAYEAMLKGE